MTKEDKFYCANLIKNINNCLRNQECSCETILNFTEKLDAKTANCICQIRKEDKKALNCLKILVEFIEEI